MTNAERQALANAYRTALQSDAEDWATLAACWREAETDEQLEAMLTRISQECVAIYHARN